MSGRKMLLKGIIIGIMLLLVSGTALADLPVVKLIATGGTIAMKIDPVKKAPVPAISGEDLIATVPEKQVGEVGQDHARSAEPVERPPGPQALAGGLPG